MNRSPYVIITPAHNEARFLPKVIESVTRQTHVPRQWIILDDRSRDGTWEIIRAASKRFGFITAVKVVGGRERRLGANVVHLFHRGMAWITGHAEFLVKMDADVLLPERYFEIIDGHFRRDPSLGMVSGKTYVRRNERWALERMPDSHVSGACKSYRWSCYKDIGGLVPILGWDIVDGAHARMKGWKTRSFGALPLYHLRPVGSARGALRGQIGHGRGMYAIRAFPPFVVARAFYRAWEPPYLAGLFLLLGYASALLRRESRLKDDRLVRFIRKEHLRRLTGATLGQEAIRNRTLPVGPAETGGGASEFAGR